MLNYLKVFKILFSGLILLSLLNCKNESEIFENEYFSINKPSNYTIDSIEVNNFSNFSRIENIKNKKSRVYIYSIYKSPDIPFKQRMGISLYNFYIRRDSVKNSQELIQNFIKQHTIRENNSSIKTIAKSFDTISNNIKFSYLIFKEDVNNDNEIKGIVYITKNEKYYPLTLKFNGVKKIFDSNDKDELFNIINSVKLK